MLKEVKDGLSKMSDTNWKFPYILMQIIWILDGEVFSAGKHQKGYTIH
jgi:hypothetical protein